MKTLAVSLFVCTIMFLHRAASENHKGTPSLMTLRLKGRSLMDDWVSSCPEGWTLSDIRCLLYVPEKKTWEEAERNCQSKYSAMLGSLVAVLDTDSSNDINKLLQSVGNEEGQVWVGGCDTRDPSWDWTTYGWTSANREHVCLRRTSGGSVSGCLKEAECDTRLPSICSIVMM